MNVRQNDLDDQLRDLVEVVGVRRARLIVAEAQRVAADVRADAEVLGGAVVEADGPPLRVLGALPPQTFTQSLFWREQLAQAAERLGGDAAQWGAPIPRCTGEEMMLRTILTRAQAADGVRYRRGWDVLFEVLFQDEDVLLLYSMSAQAAEDVARAVNLDPRQWFTEFEAPFPLPDRNW